MIVIVDDLRRAGVCGPGVRAWGEQHGFEWRDFVKNGIESDALLATGDALAARVVQIAEERHGRGG